MRVPIILNAAVVVPVDGSLHSLIVCSDEHVCVLLDVQYVDACVEEVRSAGQLPFLFLSSSVSFIIHVPQFVAWKNNPVISCGKRVCE